MNTNIRYTKVFLKSLLLTSFLGAIASAQVLAYELIDLGANIEPKAINNSGVVVGASNTDQYPSTAFSWSSDTGFKLINGGISANAVNDAGLIAGNTIDGAFIGNRQWSDYGAFGINQAGNTAGYEVGKNLLQPRSLPYNPAIFSSKKWEVYDIARLYPRGTREDVYADRFILNGINNGGYAVGYKYRYGLAGYSAILIDTNSPVNDFTDVIYLPTPAGGRAVDINDNMMIAGTNGSSSRTSPIIYSQAFVYDYNAGKTDFLVLDGGSRSYAYDINENNQVVGSSESNTGSHAFVWDMTDGMIDLHIMMSAQGWVLTSATAINDYGDIAGTGTFNGVAHGFVLSNSPISAPPPAENQPPVAVSSADVTSGKAPLRVNFDASASTDSDGTIDDYYWDFMDGGFSTEANPSHKFTKTGTYSVTLTITDDQGAEAQSVIDIDVIKKR